MYAMPRAKNEDDYYDRWAKHYSASVKTNVCPYFEWFGFPLTKGTKNFCGTLPGQRFLFCMSIIPTGALNLGLC